MKPIWMDSLDIFEYRSTKKNYLEACGKRKLAKVSGKLKSALRDFQSGASTRWRRSRYQALQKSDKILARSGKLSSLFSFIFHHLSVKFMFMK